MAKTSTERTRKWRAEHPEEARRSSTERTKKYRSENPEKVRDHGTGKYIYTASGSQEL